MKFKSLKWALAIATAHFFILSHISGFRFDQVKSFNWDIALMLSPWGIINNLLLHQQHYLAPYYFKEILLPPGFSFFPLLLFVLIQAALSFYCLWLFKKGRK